MAESSKHRARMQQQGYREYRPGYYVKANPSKTEFDSHTDALAHHESQHTDSGDLIDNAIGQMVSGGGGGK